jgi:hypothetical protein
MVEKKILLENLSDPDLYYWSSHVLDDFPLQGRLGDSRADMVARLAEVIEQTGDDVPTNRQGRTSM